MLEHFNHFKIQCIKLKQDIHEPHDYIGVIRINGRSYDMYIKKKYAYFKYDGDWFKIKIKQGPDLDIIQYLHWCGFETFRII